MEFPKSKASCIMEIATLDDGLRRRKDEDIFYYRALKKRREVNEALASWLSLSRCGGEMGESDEKMKK